MKENMLDMLIASSVLKDQNGNQLSHTLNRLQHENTHQHKAAASAAHQLMSVVFVQSEAVKVCLKKWHRRENTSEYSWHFNQSSSHSAAEDRKLLLLLLLFCYAFLRNTQEEKESWLFLSYPLSLQTTNPFKDSESQPECALSQSKGTQSNPIKVQPKERTSFFTCFNG